MLALRGNPCIERVSPLSISFTEDFKRKAYGGLLLGNLSFHFTIHFLSQKVFLFAPALCSAYIPLLLRPIQPGIFPVRRHQVRVNALLGQLAVFHY